MALKDRIQRDNQRVFMNENHFAEIHVLNGTEFSCVIDDTQSQSARLNNIRELTVYTPEDNLPIDLQPGQHVIFDERTMVVIDITDSIGMKAIHLTEQDPFML